MTHHLSDKISLLSNLPPAKPTGEVFIVNLKCFVEPQIVLLFDVDFNKRGAVFHPSISLRLEPIG